MITSLPAQDFAHELIVTNASWRDFRNISEFKGGRFSKPFPCQVSNGQPDRLQGFVMEAGAVWRACFQALVRFDLDIKVRDERQVV